MVVLENKLVYVAMLVMNIRLGHVLIVHRLLMNVYKLF
jgi:hypothetical protein